MKNKYWVSGGLVAATILAALVSPFMSGVAQAAVPTLSAYSTGSGDSVQITVNGDPNAGVLLNYRNSSGVSTISALGTTSSAGYFSISISTASYNITPGSQFSVSVAGQTSQTMTWPYQSGANGAFTFSQNYLTMNVGQSQTVTANNANSGGLFLASNSYPTVANAAISNNQITIYANTIGSTAMNFCAVSNTSNCATLNVSVVGSGQSLSLSQTSVSLTPGQSVSVTVGGGSGSYTVTGNTNPSILQAYMNGASLVLYASGGTNGTGNSTVTVCNTGTGNCGVVSAVVSSTNSGTTGLNFSQTSVSMNVGQAVAVSVSGGAGAYYLSSNTNQTAVQAGISSNTLNLYGNAAGTANLIVCSVGYGCGTVSVTVGGSGGGYMSLSQSAVSLNQGQSTSVSISGNGGYSITNNSNSSVASVYINGNNVSITALALGSTTINICQTGGQCTTLQINVTQGATNNASGLTFTNVVSVGQGINLLVSNGTAPYSLSSSATANFVASLSNGNILTVVGKAVGTSAINVCGANGACAPVNVTVVNAVSTPSTSSGHYKFYNPLKYGDRGDEVVELQKRLTEEGVFSGTATGFYGDQTLAAMKKLQSLHGLTPLGNLGPATREFLNSK